MRVLVVEDTPEILDVVAEFLREEKWQVDVAGSGEEAWEILQAHGHAIHLLLTDVVMPGLTGVELARQAIAAHPTLRVLFMSGFAEHNLDGIALVRKPFRRQVLLDAIAQTLRC